MSHIDMKILIITLEERCNRMDLFCILNTTSEDFFFSEFSILEPSNGLNVYWSKVCVKIVVCFSSNLPVHPLLLTCGFSKSPMMLHVFHIKYIYISCSYYREWAVSLRMEDKVNRKKSFPRLLQFFYESHDQLWSGSWLLTVWRSGHSPASL